MNSLRLVTLLELGLDHGQALISELLENARSTR